MKGKIKLIITCLILVFTITACNPKTLIYEPNLGYSFNDIKCSQLKFNIYNSNTVDKKWELLYSFVVSKPEAGKYLDAKVLGENNKVQILLYENYKKEDKNSIIYSGNVLDSFDFKVNGFNGEIKGNRNFKIKDTLDQQFYRLYPISNNTGLKFFNLKSLDEKYDEDVYNLDNLLITLEIIK